MFNTICTNMRLITRGPSKGTRVQCFDIAAFGPKDTKDRTYCSVCYKQLIATKTILGDNYRQNNKLCVILACTEEKKPMYGIRGTKTATHCTTCAKEFGMVNLSAKLCELQNDNNEFICDKQAKKKVENKNYCAPHAEIVAQINEAEIVSTGPKCIVCNNKEPTFILDSNTESTKPTHCKACAEASGESYHDVRHKSCEECVRLELKEQPRPIFGLEKGKPTHCNNHKSDAMFDVCNKMCEPCELKEPPVRIRACIRDDDNKLKYCFQCNPKLEEILAERAKLIRPKGCQVEGCPVEYPSFGLLWKQGTHCKAHYKDCEEKLFNVVSTKCQDAECEKFRCYGSEWRKPTHCAEHGKELNMENVISKRCKDCKIIASYGHDWQKPTHCMTHGIPKGMSNVVSKSCKNCSKRPSFGLKGKSPEYCFDHKSDDMEDLTHIKCFKCEKRACFGTEVNTPEYCYNHKTIDMQDVVHTKCECCDKRPSYGIELGCATHCVAHKSDNMFDVVSKRCEHAGCIKQASFNYEDELAKYCFNHRLNGMLNIRAIYCLTENCNIQASTTRYKGYCFSCFYQHPDYQNEPIIHNYKVKETTIMSDISKLIETPIICDKIIQGGNSKRRPDGLIQLDNRNIIIEIDENQHKNIGYENEEDRLSDIYNDLNQAPLTVIRFNPDGYNRISNGLFTKNADGIVEVVHPERYANAINELVQFIEDAIKNNPINNITIIKLRFDTC